MELSYKRLRTEALKIHIKIHKPTSSGILKSQHWKYTKANKKIIARGVEGTGMEDWCSEAVRASVFLEQPSDNYHRHHHPQHRHYHCRQTAPHQSLSLNLKRWCGVQICSSVSLLRTALIIIIDIIIIIILLFLCYSNLSKNIPTNLFSFATRIQIRLSQ